jgi:hypothetical protein
VKKISHFNDKWKRASQNISRKRAKEAQNQVASAGNDPLQSFLAKKKADGESSGDLNYGSDEDESAAAAAATGATTSHLSRSGTSLPNAKWNILDKVDLKKTFFELKDHFKGKEVYQMFIRYTENAINATNVSIPSGSSASNKPKSNGLNDSDPALVPFT